MKIFAALLLSVISLGSSACSHALLPYNFDSISVGTRHYLAANFEELQDKFNPCADSLGQLLPRFTGYSTSLKTNSKEDYIIQVDEDSSSSVAKLVVVSSVNDSLFRVNETKAWRFFGPGKLTSFIADSATATNGFFTNMNVFHFTGSHIFIDTISADTVVANVVKGNRLRADTLLVNKFSHVNKELIDSNLTVNKILTVNGASNLLNGLTVNNNPTTINYSFTSTGPTFLNGNVTVGGGFITTLSSEVDINGDVFAAAAVVIGANNFGQDDYFLDNGSGGDVVRMSRFGDLDSSDKAGMQIGSPGHLNEYVLYNYGPLNNYGPVHTYAAINGSITEYSSGDVDLSTDSTQHTLFFSGDPGTITLPVASSVIGREYVIRYIGIASMDIVSHGEAISLEGATQAISFSLPYSAATGVIWSGVTLVAGSSQWYITNTVSQGTP